jgi:antitoxin FitA
VISLLSVSESLLIRNLPESLKPALRRRAAAHGRSVEAEARLILEEAIAADEDFVSWWLDEMASAPPGKPLPLPDRSGQSREPVTFE